MRYRIQTVSGVLNVETIGYKSDGRRKWRASGDTGIPNFGAETEQAAINMVVSAHTNAGKDKLDVVCKNVSDFFRVRPGKK